MKNTIRKMRETKIKFDKDLSKEIFIRKINKKIRLILSDDLDASEEKLSDSYCKKIADFIDNFSKWYNKCMDAVKEWGENIYHINIEYDEIKLLKIFILFEQNDVNYSDQDLGQSLILNMVAALKLKQKMVIITLQRQVQLTLLFAKIIYHL